jgi:hypothetical protein
MNAFDVELPWIAQQSSDVYGGTVSSTSDINHVHVVHADKSKTIQS